MYTITGYPIWMIRDMDYRGPVNPGCNALVSICQSPQPLNESDICVQYSLLGSTASALTVECWRVISFIILKFLKKLVKSSSRPFFLSLASRSPLILSCNYRNMRSDRYVLSMKQFANVIETVGCH